MKVFTMRIDRRIGDLLEELKRELGKSSRAEVFKLGLALLKIAVDACAEGNKLAVSDGEGKIVKEIVLPVC